MALSPVAIRRLHQQHLITPHLRTPQEVVSRFCAMQAQDYHGAKWAIGIRLKDVTDAHIEAALNRAEIVRTHVLRPTWHFAAAPDIRWMLRLSGPQIRAANVARNKELELDNKVLKRCATLIGKALADGTHLTRPELMAVLNKAGIRSDDNRSAHIMMHAELEELVCNGDMRGKQFTYSLMDHRVPSLRKYDRNDALKMLAERYFTSHGPATLQDFYWWSGLKIGDARAALEAASPQLETEESNGQAYWFEKSSGTHGKKTDTVFLLPPYDEFLVGYKDRSAALNPSHNKTAISVNGIFYPTIVCDGEVKGLWKRTFRNDTAVIEPQFFPASKAPARARLKTAAERYAVFHGKKSVIV